jgi:predicted nucleotide-binding protein
MNVLTVPPWKRLIARLEGCSLGGHSSSMTPDEIQTLLQAHNIGFSAKEIPHGRQFRMADGAIANVYTSGKIVWQGKDTATALKIKGLCGATEPVSAPTTSKDVVSLSNNKVFIVYGHDIECREQLELLLRELSLNLGDDRGQAAAA